MVANLLVQLQRAQMHKFVISSLPSNPSFLSDKMKGKFSPSCSACKLMPRANAVMFPSFTSSSPAVPSSFTHTQFPLCLGRTPQSLRTKVKGCLGDRESDQWTPGEQWERGGQGKMLAVTGEDQKEWCELVLRNKRSRLWEGQRAVCVDIHGAVLRASAECEGKMRVVINTGRSSTPVRWNRSKGLTQRLPSEPLWERGRGRKTAEVHGFVTLCWNC